MLADNHALVDRIAGLDKERTARFEVEQGIGYGIAGPVGTDAASVAAREVAAPFLIAFKVGIHDACSLGVGEKFVLVADEAARGNGKFKTDTAGAGVVEIEHLALALVDFLGHHAHEAFVAVHVEMLDGLKDLAVLGFLQDDLGASHRELKAFPAHGFHQDGHLEFAAALDDEAVIFVRRLHAYGHVAQRLLFKAVLDDAALQELAFMACQGRGVDAYADGDRGLVNGNAGQGCRLFARADSVADCDVLNAGQNDDVARIDLVHFLDRHSLVDLELGGAQGARHIVCPDTGQLLVVVDRAVHDAADGQAAEIVRVVKVGYQHLEGLVRIVFGPGYVLENCVEEGRQILSLVLGLVHGNPVAAYGVQHREFKLLVIGTEVDEQVVDIVEDFFYAGVLAVDLVDDDDNRQMGLQGLAQDKARLGQGAF